MVVVVVVVVVVPVVSGAVVVTLVSVVVVLVGGGDCADPGGTSAASTPAAASASPATAIKKARLIAAECSPPSGDTVSTHWAGHARQDARIVRDYAVDPGNQHPLERRLVVHGPGEDGGSVRMGSFDYGA